MGLSRWSAAGGDRMNHENSPFFLTQNKKTVYVYTEVELEEKEKEKNALTICRGGWKWHYTPWLFFFFFPAVCTHYTTLKKCGIQHRNQDTQKTPKFCFCPGMESATSFSIKISLRKQKVVSFK